MNEPSTQNEMLFRALINQTARRAHDNAVAKGFYDCTFCKTPYMNADGSEKTIGRITGCVACNSTRREDPTIEQRLLLMVSEIVEAYEEFRSGHDPRTVYYSEGGKPEGIPVELADVVIRIMDYCAYQGIDLGTIIVEKMNYNATRPYRHGGKRS